MLTADTVINLSYDAPSGKVRSMHRSDSQGAHELVFDWDGRLPTSESWVADSGLTQGVVSIVPDDHFRMDKVRVNGIEVVDYGYDLDGLVTSAGPLTIGRRSDN